MADAEELKLLSHPRLLQDAGSCQVVWARVKGYPYWPAQVLSDSAAQRKLGKVSHKKNADVPVMFFGTLEIAWIGQLDVVAFGEGITAGYLAKGKQKTFLKACAQVLEFLCLDKKRKAPQAWWCRPPEASLPLPTEQAKANSKPCTPSKKVVARGKPTCSPTASTSSDNSADSAMESGCEEEQCVLASAIQPVIGKPAASLPVKGSLSCSKLPKCKACPAAQLSKPKSAQGLPCKKRVAAECAVSGSESGSISQTSSSEDQLEEEVDNMSVTVTGKGNSKPPPQQPQRKDGARGKKGCVLKQVDVEPLPACMAPPARKRLRAAASAPSSLAAPASTSQLTDSSEATAAASDPTSARPVHNAAPAQVALPAVSDQHQVHPTAALAPASDTSGAAAAMEVEQQVSPAAPGLVTPDSCSPPNASADRNCIQTAAAPLAADHASSPCFLDDQDVSKLPAEIRRLAGIKLVKRQPLPKALPVEHTPSSAQPAALADATNISHAEVVLKAEPCEDSSKAAVAAEEALSQRKAGHNSDHKAGGTSGKQNGSRSLAYRKGTRSCVSAARLAVCQAAGTAGGNKTADCVGVPAEELAECTAATADVQQQAPSSVKTLQEPPDEAKPVLPDTASLQEPAAAEVQPPVTAAPPTTQLAASHTEGEAGTSPAAVELQGQCVNLAAQQTGAQEQEVAKRLDRETQLQRKRDRERERRLGLKLAKQQAAPTSLRRREAAAPVDVGNPSTLPVLSSVSSIGAGNSCQQPPDACEPAPPTAGGAVAMSAQEPAPVAGSQPAADTPAAVHPVSDHSSLPADSAMAAPVLVETVEQQPGCADPPTALQEGDMASASEVQPANSKPAVRRLPQPPSLGVSGGVRVRKAGGSNILSRSSLQRSRPQLPAPGKPAAEGKAALPASGADLVACSTAAAERGTVVEPGPSSEAVPALKTKLCSAPATVVVAVPVSGLMQEVLPPVLAPPPPVDAAAAISMPCNNASTSSTSSPPRISPARGSSSSLDGSSSCSGGSSAQQEPAQPPIKSAGPHGSPGKGGMGLVHLAGQAECVMSLATEAPHAAPGTPDEDQLDAEAAEVLQFMQSMDATLVNMLPPMAAAQQSQTLVLDLPQAAAQPTLSVTVEQAIAATPSTAVPAAYVVPRTTLAACSAFRWPAVEPLLPAAPQDFMLPKPWLIVRPPRYEHIRRNVWLSRPRPKRLHKEEINVCMCRQAVATSTQPADSGDTSYLLPGCQAGCLNRVSYIHCDPRSCPCGEACSNRPFHKLKGPDMEPFLTDSRRVVPASCSQQPASWGYGVRVLQPVAAGAFLLEYAGEVVDDKELARRMDAAKAANEPCYYIMELGPNLYIDARSKGNYARLLNSSCDANCETQKWHDAATGEPRIGIFAKRPIAPGEELTYDYFFEHYGVSKLVNVASFECKCGAANCRGTMDANPEKRKDLGRRVEVFWDADGIYYPGTVVGYSTSSRRHVILYDAGDKERVCLNDIPHRWLDDGSLPSSLAQLPLGLAPLPSLSATPGALLSPAQPATSADGWPSLADPTQPWLVPSSTPLPGLGLALVPPGLQLQQSSGLPGSSEDAEEDRVPTAAMGHHEALLAELCAASHAAAADMATDAGPGRSIMGAGAYGSSSVPAKKKKRGAEGYGWNAAATPLGEVLPCMGSKGVDSWMLSCPGSMPTPRGAVLTGATGDRSGGKSCGWPGRRERGTSEGGFHGPAGPAHGCDMASLLQAVESELGGRDASSEAAAAEGHAADRAEGQGAQCASADYEGEPGTTLTSHRSWQQGAGMAQDGMGWGRKAGGAARGHGTGSRASAQHTHGACGSGAGQRAGRGQRAAPTSLLPLPTRQQQQQQQQQQQHLALCSWDSSSGPVTQQTGTLGHGQPWGSPSCLWSPQPCHPHGPPPHTLPHQARDRGVSAGGMDRATLSSLVGVGCGSPRLHDPQAAEHAADTLLLPGLSAPSSAPRLHSHPLPQLEELLGIKISTFSMPLFHKPPPSGPHARHAALLRSSQTGMGQDIPARAASCTLPRASSASTPLHLASNRQGQHTQRPATSAADLSAAGQPVASSSHTTMPASGQGQSCPAVAGAAGSQAPLPAAAVAAAVEPAQAHLPLPACTRQSSSALPAEQPDAGQPPSPSQLSLPAASTTHPGDPCCSAPPACTTTTATCSGERQQPSMAAGAGGPGYAASCSDALTGVLAILINSPLLASMATLHGNLMGIDSLNGSLDLFKRNGSSSSSSGSGLPQAAGSVLMSSHTSSKAAAQVLLQQG
ncbi:hypothetical protein QJQ45_025473 [Haematococcus lacustris]|nr:hypothetical protein QJQ45_025473 [Haematococcus lacustris]